MNLNEIESTVKNMLIVMWCVWVLIMGTIALFNVSSGDEFFVGLFAMMLAFAVPAHYIDI